MAKALNRHAQRRAATHQRLIDAARALIVEQGYNNVDILDITDYADVSKATFYTHFQNKEACVREMMEQGFDALVDELLVAQDELDPNWMHCSLERVFDWARANRELLLIMVGGAASSQLNGFGRQYMVQVVKRTLVMQPALDDPSPYPPVIQAQIVTGIMIQLLGWWLVCEPAYTPDMLASLVLNVLHHGLTYEPPDGLVAALHELDSTCAESE